MSTRDPEKPDTAAIREEIGTRNHVCVNGTLAFDLCDALDSARALPDYAEWEQLRLIAAQGQARAEAAEARIAAALAWFADTDCTWTYRVEMARRALTEGTGQ